MRNFSITGWGSYLPSTKVHFDDQVRYRISDAETQLDMLAGASAQALARAGVRTGDLDAIIVAAAAGVQPIPCTAALLQERLDKKARAAALDINTTCTSFITALDIASRYLHDGTYQNVLLVSGDVGTRFLNPQQRESFELFSDAAAAVVLTATDNPDIGVIHAAQQTWAAHAHDTEIRGGLSALPPRDYPGADPADYLFDMDGRGALLSMARVLPEFFNRFWAGAELSVDDVSIVIPHQASRALELVMRRIGVPEGKYVNRVTELGNMVSASVPYVLVEELESGRLGAGDTVLLCGTAAGLTVNALALRL